MFETFKRKSVEVGVFEAGESLWAQISDGRGRRPPTTVGARKLEWFPFRAFVWYQNICSASFGFVTKHACDRQMDRITTSKTALAIAASRGKKWANSTVAINDNVNRNCPVSV